MPRRTMLVGITYIFSMFGDTVLNMSQISRAIFRYQVYFISYYIDWVIVSHNIEEVRNKAILIVSDIDYMNHGTPLMTRICQDRAVLFRGYL